MIGVVLAESQSLAQRAAAAVIVQYEPLDAIITIRVCVCVCGVCVCVRERERERERVRVCVCLCGV